MTDVFGFLMTVCFITCYIPQMIKIVRTKSVEDISPVMYVIASFGNFFAVLYGIWDKRWRNALARNRKFGVSGLNWLGAYTLVQLQKTMRHVRCPELPLVADVKENTTLFLAGGITGCQDWQDDMAKLLTPAKNLIVLNPRRSNFNTGDKSMSMEQIKWEKTMLDGSDMISFWFPKETVCPITLFELGYRLARNQRSLRVLFVGCDPEYTRLLDIQTQISLIPWCGEIKIVYSVEDLAAQVLDRVPCRYPSAK